MYKKAFYIYIIYICGIYICGIPYNISINIKYNTIH